MVVPSRIGTASWVRLAAVGLAILLVGWLVIERSTSAFGTSTASTGNTVASGSVQLVDDDAGAALFDVSAMGPGQVETRCIEVTYSGSMTPAVPVTLYGGYLDGPDANPVADSTLAPYLDTTVRMGTAGSTCAAFTPAVNLFTATAPVASTGRLDVFAGTYTSFATGIDTTWTPVGGANETRAFQVSLTVVDDNAAQAKVAEPTFTWEVRSS